ncbi:hypothetical protein [Vibrio injensis]|uniref:hypothetical protein n=1 Tax=Vibrio injensis TaxID=1307414 RepID=UPI00278C1BFA|nr:hypothetical protein [Vibrio injensis]
MNYLRITIYFSLGLLASYQVIDQFGSAFSNESIIKIDGILNIWASYSGALICFYLIVYSISDEFELKLPIGEINKVLIVSGVIVGPLLAIGNYSLTQANVKHYVECTDARKLSSRYSSRTYAISPEFCTTIAHRKGT